MEIQHINKHYGKRAVLKDISFNANKGRCIGILGGNGSGKSTLLSILAGVQKANGGDFIYDGINLFKNKKKMSDLVGYVPQNTPLLDELSALDNLRLWYDGKELRNQLDFGVLKKLGIPSFLNVAVCKMSGGMKKRLAIGCAVAHNPEVLLLDEPSAALDLICKESISSYLLDFKSKNGTIILATHDVQELNICDELYILKGGILTPYIFDGDIHKLISRL